MDRRVSVIVPVYNVEKYLHKCIVSIISQSYADLEIILVDDGSNDRSGSICDDYACKDKRIRVIHKRNGGLSDARNAALNICTGRYITFIDGDDYVSKYYVEQLLNNLETNKSDISICNERRFYLDESGKEIIIASPYPDCRKNCVVSGIEGIEYFLYQEIYDTSACGKLYKNTLFNGIRYPIGKTFEDLATTYKLFLKSRSVSYFSTELYCYLQRNSSIVHQTDYKTISDGIEAAEQLNALPNKHPELYRAVMCRRLSMYFHFFFLLNREKDKIMIQSLWKKITDIRFGVLFDVKARKKARMAALLSFSGKWFTYKTGRKFLYK